LAPGIGAECLTILVLRDVNGLQESLREVGDGAGGSRLYMAADDSGDEARQSGAEIAGGEVVAGEEIVEVLAEFLCGAGPGFFFGVVGAEMRMFGGARSAALAAVGKGETTQGLAVVWTERGHR
jgi:hypothetical protein